MSVVDHATARALLAVAGVVYAELDRAGLVTDDVPELVLAIVARWCDGTATETEVRELRVQVGVSRPALDESLGPGDNSRAVRFFHAVTYYLVTYIGGGRGTRRRFAEEQTVAMAWMCLHRLGEPMDAAKARIEATYLAAMSPA